MNPPNVNTVVNAVLHPLTGFKHTRLGQKFSDAIKKRVEHGRDFIATRSHTQQASAAAPKAPGAN